MKNRDPQDSENPKSNTVIDRLSTWYGIHCDGSKESAERIRIVNLDNPGWMLTINLRDTECENRIFQPLKEDISDDDWYRCKIENRRFVGVGDQRRLSFLIQTFLCFAKMAEETGVPRVNEDTLERLCQWYQSQCNGTWEHAYGVRIDTVDNPGWVLTVDLSDTALESKVLTEVTVNNYNDDWHFWKTKDRQFIASGDPTKLPLLVESFLEFSKSSEPSGSASVEYEGGSNIL